MPTRPVRAHADSTETSSIEDAFLALLLAEEEWVDAEFDAIVAAAQSGSPPAPQRRRVCSRPTPTTERPHGGEPGVPTTPARA